jgi:type II secretory pathway pseudopilin PulG
MPNTSPKQRHGITILEVLISIGILSVGLASVLALLPAGGSQARKAMVDDRRSALGENALADCQTRGLLNPLNWSGAATPPVMIDPLGQASGVQLVPAGMTLVNVAGLSTSALADFAFRGTDDLVFTIPDNEDLAPVPVFQGDSRRLTEGNFSWLATIVPMTTGSSPFYRLSAVEFYRRSFDSGSYASSLQLPGSFSGPSGTIAGSPTLPFDKDTFKTFFPTGGVVLVTTSTTSFQWRRILMAAPTYTTDETALSAIDLTFNEDIVGATGMIYAYAGAVGVAEKIVRLEEAIP